MYIGWLYMHVQKQRTYMTCTHICIQPCDDLSTYSDISLVKLQFTYIYVRLVYPSNLYCAFMQTWGFYSTYNSPTKSTNKYYYYYYYIHPANQLCKPYTLSGPSLTQSYKRIPILSDDDFFLQLLILICFFFLMLLSFPEVEY